MARRESGRGREEACPIQNGNRKPQEAFEVNRKNGVRKNMPAKKLTAFALNCSLKPSDDKEDSSTDRLLSDLNRAEGRKLSGRGGMTTGKLPVAVAEHRVR